MGSDDEYELDDKRHAKRFEKRVKMRQRLSEQDDSRSRTRLLEEDEESQSMLTMLKVCDPFCHSFFEKYFELTIVLRATAHKFCCCQAQRSSSLFAAIQFA